VIVSILLFQAHFAAMARATLLMAIALPCILAENANRTALRGAHEWEHVAGALTGNTTKESQAFVPSDDVHAEVRIPNTPIEIPSIARWLAENDDRFRAAVAVTAFRGILEEMGRRTASILSEIFNSLAPSPDFSRVVGWFGMRLTVGVINDSPFPVRIAKHEVLRGSEFSFSSESRVLQPGEEAKWEAYTSWGGSVRLAIQLNFEDRAHTHYTVHAAKFRLGSWFCKSLRGEVFKGDWHDVWGHQRALCDLTDGAKSRNDDKVAFFVADVPVH